MHKAFISFLLIGPISFSWSFRDWAPESPAPEGGALTSLLNRIFPMMMEAISVRIAMGILAINHSPQVTFTFAMLRIYPTARIWGAVAVRMPLVEILLKWISCIISCLPKLLLPGTA